MTNTIGPGDWVECVKAHTSRIGWISLTIGNHYQVCQVVSDPYAFRPCEDCGNQPDGLTLVGDPRILEWGAIGARCPCAFRLMRRPTDFSALLHSIPQSETV